MESGDGEREEYVVPRYRAAGDPAWFHALHGAIPGHQLDFMYCPEAPQGAVSQTHIGHLSRLMKYIEPRHGAPFAFAVANLSRDDIQYEPGHGGLGLIFALRVTGVVDHAGRAKPSYSHGAITADRRLDYTTLLEAISILYRRFLEKDAQEEDTTGGFYRSYFHMKRDQPEAVEAFLRDYVDHFDELPQPPRSHLGLEWEANEEDRPEARDHRSRGRRTLWQHRARGGEPWRAALQIEHQVDDDHDGPRDRGPRRHVDSLRPCERGSARGPTAQPARGSKDGVAGHPAARGAGPQGIAGLNQRSPER